MKKFGKLIAFVTIAGAAVAGFWYFLDRMKEDEFYKDLDFEGEDEETEEEPVVKREYVSLDTSEEKMAEAEAAAKRTLKETVKSVAQDMMQKAEDIAKGVGIVKEEDKDEASDFEFKSFDETEETAAKETEENASESAETENAAE